MIRANQGHSIKLQIQMNTFKQNNSQLVHATYYNNMESIQKSGLKILNSEISNFDSGWLHLIASRFKSTPLALNLE